MRSQQITLNARLRQVFLRTLLFAALLLPATLHAQLKIGDDATNITPSAILELNSTAQGFLLPRIADWQINTVFGSHPKGIPDGMVVYYDKGPLNDSTGVYIRKDQKWVQVTTSENIDQRTWSRSGNTIGTGGDTLGSLNAADVKIITNGAQRILLGASGLVRFTTDSVAIDGRLSVGGRAVIDSALTVGDTVFAGGLHTRDRALVEGNLVLPNTAGQTLFTELLVIDTATGVVSRRTIDPDVLKVWRIGNFDETGFATGIERRSGGASGIDTLLLHGATATMPGGVSVTSQEFAGNKTFKDSAVVEGTLRVGAPGTAVKATLEVQGSLSLKLTTVTANYTVADDDYTVLANGNNIGITLPAPAAANEGRIYVIKKTAATSFTQPVKLIGHIEGITAAEIEIYNAGTALKLQSNGTTWWIIDRM